MTAVSLSRDGRGACEARVARVARVAPSGGRDSIRRVEISGGSSANIGGGRTESSSRAANVLVPIWVAVGRDGGRCRIGLGSVGGGAG